MEAAGWDDWDDNVEDFVGQEAAEGTADGYFDPTTEATMTNASLAAQLPAKYDPYEQGIAIVQFIVASIMFIALVYFIIRDYIELQERIRLQQLAGDGIVINGEPDDDGGDPHEAGDDDPQFPNAAPEGTPAAQFRTDPVAAAAGAAPVPRASREQSTAHVAALDQEDGAAAAVGAVGGIDVDDGGLARSRTVGSSVKLKKMRYSRKTLSSLKSTRSIDSDALSIQKIYDDDNDLGGILAALQPTERRAAATTSSPPRSSGTDVGTYLSSSAVAASASASPSPLQHPSMLVGSPGDDVTAASRNDASTSTSGGGLLTSAYSQTSDDSATDSSAAGPRMQLVDNEPTVDPASAAATDIEDLTRDPSLAAGVETAPSPAWQPFETESNVAGEVERSTRPAAKVRVNLDVTSICCSAVFTPKQTTMIGKCSTATAHLPDVQSVPASTTAVAVDSDIGGNPDQPGSADCVTSGTCNVDASPAAHQKPPVVPYSEIATAAAAAAKTRVKVGPKSATRTIGVGTTSGRHHCHVRQSTATADGLLSLLPHRTQHHHHHHHHRHHHQTSLPTALGPDCANGVCHVTDHHKSTSTAGSDKQDKPHFRVQFQVSGSDETNETVSISPLGGQPTTSNNDDVITATTTAIQPPINVDDVLATDLLRQTTPIVNDQRSTSEGRPVDTDRAPVTDGERQQNVDEACRGGGRVEELPPNLRVASGGPGELREHNVQSRGGRSTADVGRTTVTAASGPTDAAAISGKDKVD